MLPAPGTLLVATAALTDASFARSVIFLLEHSPQGTLGLIINRPLDATLSDIWGEVPAGLADARAAAEGGPVEREKGLLLHGGAGLPGAQTMSPGIAVGGDLEALAKRYANGPDRSGPRLFLGHSGWAPGQLDHELAEGAWIVRPGRPDQLFDPAPSDQLWRRLCDGRGTLPDPSLN